MMKALPKTFLIFCSFLFIQCSNDNSEVNNVSDVSALFVNGSAFNVGLNSTTEIYNMIDEYNHRTDFQIIEFIVHEPDDIVNPDVIELEFYYTGNQVDGIYPVYSYPIAENIPPNHVRLNYNTLSLFFGNLGATGNIKINNLGNKRFRLEFDNVVIPASDGSGETKTLNGYCQAKFW